MKRACVIGWPIEHSRSPMIHGAWIKRHGIDGSYTKIAVRPEDAATFFRTLGEQGLAGCNVTAPLKEAAFAAAAWRDTSAEAVGAANTLWLDGAKLCAANTDTYGFMRHLDASAPAWKALDAPVVILGAGGAARTIAFGFLEAGVTRVCIVNRTLARGQAIAAHFGARVQAYDWNALPTALAGARVLVNTTTVGMAKAGVAPAPLDIDIGALRRDCIVADIVYVPLETDLLARARARGHTCVDGLGMLLHQAVPGFEKWFGVRPEVTLDLRALIVRDIEGV